MTDRVVLLMDAVKANDADVVRQLLSAHAAELQSALESPIPGWAFGETPLIAAARARNREMIDALLDAGADINAKTKWWAGGFGVFDELGGDVKLAEHLIERGAFVDVHAAVRLGKLDHLRMLLGASPSLVHARGGDGMLPLHFADSVEVAEYLLSCGADIDAIDVDHESTAVQYMVRERQEVARYLVARGCRTDILLAAALGDAESVERHLRVNPAAIRTCVSPQWFPMKDMRAGGSIYIWTLGRLKTGHQVAFEFEHPAVFQMLMEHSPAGLRLAVACELGSDLPDVVPVDPVDQDRIVQAAQSDDPAKILRMLDCGWPVAARDPGGATALHWAAFHGNAAAVGLLLERDAPIGLKDYHHGRTPFVWAEYGSDNSWIKTGDYPTVMRLLGGSAATSPANSPSA